MNPARAASRPSQRNRRAAAFPKRGIRLIVTGVLIAAVLGPCFISLGKQLDERFTRTNLLRNGVSVSGRILGSNCGCEPQAPDIVEYSFRVNGQVIAGKMQIPPNRASHFNTGSAVRVRFLPHNPLVSRIELPGNL